MSGVTLSTATWTPIGPAPVNTADARKMISGRVQAAATDPTAPDTVYLGADGGGVWKNINPPSWTPLTDQQPSLQFGTGFSYHPLVVHPAEHNLVLGLVSGPGAGILKSTNAGQDWQLLANSQFNDQQLLSLAVHPTDTNTMFLAAGWDGAWKSIDGGTSWKQISGGLPANGFVCDLIIANFDPSTLYAAVIGFRSATQQAQNGVYQSTDGQGAVWTQLSGGLPSGAALGVQDAKGNTADGAVRIESGSGAGVVYVSMLTVGTDPTKGVTAVQRFRTTNGGTNWSPLAASPGGLEARSWHLLLAVDPGNDNHIFVNDAYSLFESTNAGQNWAPADAGIGYDYVNLTFDANGQAVVTGDQGVWRYDAATQSLTSRIEDLEVSEFYTICLDPSTAGVAYAIGQDIGSAKFSGQTEWQAIGGVGETGKIVVNPNNTSELFGFNPLDTNNFVVTSPDAAKTWKTVFPASKLSAAFLKTYNTSGGYAFAYLSQKAFAMDPSNPARLLVVADRVFETTNSGASWNDISGVLSQDKNNPFVAALAIAPSDPNTVYASTQDGHLWVTHDDGATKWTQLDTGLSGVAIDIRVDPNDANHAFAVAGNNVWHLPSSATTWVNITGSIPNDLGLYTVFVWWQPTGSTLFVGTDRGIYRSDDIGATWAKWVVAGLPNVRVNDLQGETLNGQLLLAAATFGRGAWEIPVVARAVNFELHRDHYGQDEIDALRNQSLTHDAVVGGGPAQSPICVTVDGFTARELGVTGPGSYTVGPQITFNPPTGVNGGLPVNPVSLDSTEGSFPPDDLQRFRFHYNVDFGTDDSAFNFSGLTEEVDLSATYQGLTAQGQVTFMKQPDPFIMQGAQTWWLSSDVRLIQVAQGDSAFGVPMGTDPFQFLQELTTTLTKYQGRVPVGGGVIESFDDNIDEQQEMITVAPLVERGFLNFVPVFNFAIARVHYQALIQPASHVRVFFRLFGGNSTDTSFHVGSTYRRVPATYPVPPANYGQPVTATGGVVGSEYVSLPCYGVPRQAPDQSGNPGTLPAKQFDTFNDLTLNATGGPVQDTFYGAFLDINQSANALPHPVPAGNPDGPWPPGTAGNSDLEPLAKAFARNDHHCVVAEIAFDPVAIADGTQPFNSDKLAQRNLAWSTVANPGTHASRIAFQNFEVRPSPVSLQAGDTPDEILIDWNTVPAGSTAEIYLPAVDADAVIATADRLYPHRLTRVDAHTIGVPAGGLTYIPLPTGVAGGANFAGLISVELPAGIRAGELHTLTVHQLTRATADITPPPPPPQIQIEAVVARNNKSSDPSNTISWRTVLGSFQINVPVSTKQLMLPKEEIRLSIFRWIAQSIAPSERWYPVFQRFLGLLANKVADLGGNPDQITPSANGFDGIPGKHKPRPPVHEGFEYGGVTGKIDGLLFDHFGDFEGFVLELFHGTKRKFASRQRDIETLARAAFEHRTLVTVSHTEHDPEAVCTLAFRTRAPWRHD
ncbi:MAG: hypothetical protein QJR12_03945 [Mycobacterium sp.]|uniref:WD40/YVTN/BNR-like repeat-containing protein n=1 Tax=Mycobacterium sp. TaxID=1785 RepID=UPI0026154C27|nr:hypothetical protein [Mycobacterium sp.]MDI3313452.1 hypothetical protein [Mycobacterium sp.]